MHSSSVIHSHDEFRCNRREQNPVAGNGRSRSSILPYLSAQELAMIRSPRAQPAPCFQDSRRARLGASSSRRRGFVRARRKVTAFSYPRSQECSPATISVGLHGRADDVPRSERRTRRIGLPACRRATIWPRTGAWARRARLAQLRCPTPRLGRPCWADNVPPLRGPYTYTRTPFLARTLLSMPGQSVAPTVPAAAILLCQQTGFTEASSRKMGERAFASKRQLHLMSFFNGEGLAGSPTHDGARPAVLSARSAIAVAKTRARRGTVTVRMSAASSTAAMKFWIESETGSSKRHQRNPRDWSGRPAKACPPPPRTLSCIISGGRARQRADFASPSKAIERQ